MVEEFDVIQFLGPLAGSLPRGAAVFGLMVAAAAGVRLTRSAIGARRSLLLLATWVSAMMMFVATCVVFQSFAWGTPPALVAASGLVVAYQHPLAAVLVLGMLTAAFIEVTRGSGRIGVSPGEAPPLERRSAAIGGLGEALVRGELLALRWPFLSNVILGGRDWSVEIDHLVRAPDGIVVLETKTFSGLIEGEPGAAVWRHRVHGRTYKFRNPLLQNDAHLRAVRSVVGDAAVGLRGLVVVAGRAQLAPSITGCVVPVGRLGVVLASAATAATREGAIDAAWDVLVAEAAQSERRREAHADFARARRERNQ